PIQSIAIIFRWTYLFAWRELNTVPRRVSHAAIGRASPEFFSATVGFAVEVAIGHSRPWLRRSAVRCN
ncbi:unnamed protein product, partial [Musa acuminata subsp. burmannicoides]